MVNSASGPSEVLSSIEDALDQKIRSKDKILLSQEQGSYEDYLRTFHAAAALREARKLVEGVRKELSL